MSRIWDAAHLAVLDLVMQPARLLVDVDEAIVLAGEDGDRHSQLAVGFRRQHCSWHHQRCFGGAGTKLRWAHSQGFGEAVEFSRDGFRSEQLPQHRRPHQAAEDRGNRVTEEIAKSGDGRPGHRHHRVGARGREIIARSQYQGLDHRRMSACQGDRDRRSPGVAEHNRLFDAEMRKSFLEEVGLGRRCPKRHCAAAGCGRSPGDRTRSHGSPWRRDQSGHWIRNPGSCCHCHGTGPKDDRILAQHSASGHHRYR